MKLWSGVLRLALILNVVVSAENTYHSTTTDRGVKKKVGNSIFHKLWKRENSCPDGEYRAENYCCKFCNPGEYALSDCTQEHGDPDCKDCIEGTNYMDSKNGYRSCHICRLCDAGIALEELSACTVIRNRVCKCKEGFFCAENKTAESDGCTDCHHCTKCEHGYAEQCSSIKDAVCNPIRTGHYYALLAIVPLVIVILIIYNFCRKSGHLEKRRNSGSKSYSELTVNSPSGSKPFIFPEDLKDIDLTNHLWNFAQKMDSATVLSAVRTMALPEVTIEDIQKDYQHESQEQRYQLLKKWYEAHGRIGALQDLIRTLHEAKKIGPAEDLLEIVRRQLQQNQA